MPVRLRSARDPLLLPLLTMLLTNTGQAAATAHDGPALLAVPGWGRPGQLQLRTEATPEGHGLLLRRDQGAVYRFDAVRGTLAAVDGARWESATGAVADCQRQLPATAVRIDTETGAAHWGSQLLRTGGEQAVTALRSPSGGLAALLSAARPRASLMPALGAGHRAPFYHQTLRLADGRLVGPAQRLPFGRGVSAVAICWSADERFVAYTNLIMTVLAVVRIDLEGNPP